MLLVAFLVITIIVIYRILIKPHQYWKNRGCKQGKPFLIFGDMFYKCIRRQSFAGYVKYVYDMVPNTRYSGFYQFFTPTLVIKDAELLKRITVKDFDYFNDHSQFVPEYIDSIWTKNLFILRGLKWKEMRNTLTPCFTGNKMKYIFSLILETSEKVIKNLEAQHTDLLEIEFRDLYTRFTNDVIASTAFGIRVDSLSDKNNKFYSLANKVTDFSGVDIILRFFGFLTIPKLMKLFGFTVFPSYVYSFFSSIISDTVETRKAKNIKRPDMLQLLMEAHKLENSGQNIKKPLTHEEMLAQAIVFYFAGYEPVSALMCFVSYELGINPNIQSRLRAEIQEVSNELNGDITYDALMNMKYLDMVILESLRKWPTAVAVDRMCTKSYTIPAESPQEKTLHIEKGTIIWLPIYALHHDPVNFPDPSKFDPERFNKENISKIKPYTYMPYGSGPRKCIGARLSILEVKLIIFQILKHYQIVPISKTVVPLVLCRKSFNATAEGGFWFGLKHL